MVNILSCRTQIYFKESFLSNEGMQEAWCVKIQKCHKALCKEHNCILQHDYFSSV